MQAVLLAPDPGNDGGGAVADVIFGDYDPGGKLPFTYPRSPGYLPTYDALLWGDAVASTFNPQWEFGRGLSYTSFEYSDLVVPKSFDGTGVLDVSVRIRNTGRHAGSETAILFMRDEVASLTPAAKRVKRFSKVFLARGESEKLTFTLTREDLEFVGADLRRVAEPGDFTVSVGGLSARFELIQ